MNHYTTKESRAGTGDRLKTSISRDAGVAVITMAGPVDRTSESAAHQQIAEGLANDQRVVLDFSRVTGSERAALRVLTTAFRRAQHHRVRFGVSGLSPELGRIVREIGLIPHIVIDDDARACAHSVRKDNNDHPGT